MIELNAVAPSDAIAPVTSSATTSSSKVAPEREWRERRITAPAS
jgi:hypothetical protein